MNCNFKSKLCIIIEIKKCVNRLNMLNIELMNWNRVLKGYYVFILKWNIMIRLR